MKWVWDNYVELVILTQLIAGDLLALAILIYVIRGGELLGG